jgi:hypothetical protein
MCRRANPQTSLDERGVVIQGQDDKGYDRPNLVDSGADKELVSRRYAKKCGMKIYTLETPIRLYLMDGKTTQDIRQATWQKMHLQGTNGVRRFLIQYLVCDIPEDMVLGMRWLAFANPAINWKTRQVTWTTDEKARQQRTRIVQSAIEANEPPAWVLRDFQDVLQPRKTGTLPPHRPGIDYEVKLKPDFRPARQKNRSFSPGERRMFAELAEEETKAGRWRISDSPQAVQMLWAVKAGGKKRPCQDYRPINMGMVDDAYPIPIIRDLLTEAAGRQFYTSLDLPRAYNEIRIKDKFSEDMLSFYCNDKLYAPTVMQFGSKTAVSHFQRFIHLVLDDLVGKGVLAYLDNVMIYADTLEEHDRLLRAVLTRFREWQLPIQPSKCEWQKDEVQFCGFMIGKLGMRLDPEKVKVISEWQPPTPELAESVKRTRIREFVGFCNYYREAVPDFSKIVTPLTDLTGKAPWKWGDEQDTAWKLLKTAVLSSVVMAAYDERLPIETHTDASDRTIASVVEHRYTCGHTRPLAFYSRKLNPAERNYTVHDKELLAIKETFRHFRSWMHGSPEPVKVWSDHKALQHFLTTTKLTQRHARWAQELGEFRFQIQHVKGTDNTVADVLSRKEGGWQEEQEGRVLEEGHFAP